MVGAPRLIRAPMAQVTENPLRQQKKINARLAGVSIISSQPFGGFAPCAHKCRQDPLDGWRGRPIKSAYKCSLVVTTKWYLIGLDVFSFHDTSIYQYNALIHVQVIISNDSISFLIGSRFFITFTVRLMIIFFLL